MMLQGRLHSAISPLIASRSRSNLSICNIVKNGSRWNSNSIELLAQHINNPIAATNSNKSTISKATGANNEISCCVICQRIFTSNPLSKRSKKSCVCIGCKRLYAQCRNDQDMRLMKSIQTYTLGHGIYNHGIVSRHMVAQNHNYFTANKFKLLNMQADFHTVTQMAERWDQEALMADLDIKGDIWNDQHLDLSTLLDMRASSFSKHTKNRYRKLFPEAKLVNEKFKFPTYSQLKGFMEASNGFCSWSGLRGQWRQETSSCLLLLSIDHIVPVSKHGSPNLDNLQVVLATYNSVKSDEFESEMIHWLYYS